MAPEMQGVDSSSVESVGFDPQTNELWVAYVGGATYVYAPVPRFVYRDLLDSASVGTYVNRFIKPRFGCRAL